ncbi:MAG TPA: hypothetical protein VFZ35_07380, partial [Sphingomicrobium sp.]
MALRFQPSFLLLLPFAGLIAACQPESADNAGDNAVNDSQALPPIPIAEPPMDRSGLLLAVARAASAAALGRDDVADQRRLDGRRLEIRIRFGCPNGVERPMAAAMAAAPFGIGFEPEKRTLRVRATPDLTLDSAGVKALGGEEVEAVEGFWIYRPWLLTDGCPAIPQAAAPEAEEEDGETGEQSRDEPQADPEPAPRGSRVGIAHFFTKSDPRTGRRDNRSYEATKILAEGEEPSRQ